MRYISIIILLVLCLTLLLFTGCMINTVTPEIASGNLENQEDINPSSDNYQSPSTDLVYELGTEEPGTIYPQKWATGTGTEEDPWANGCVESAVAACPAGGTVYLKAGYYQLAALVNVNKSMNIIGEGIGNTIVLTADAHGFYGDGVDYVTIKGLTVNGDAQTTNGTKYLTCMVFNESTYLLLEDIEVKNSARYGWDGNDNNHLLFQNFYAHDNYRHGIHPMANRAGTNMYNVYRDVYCWNNGVNGISDIGSEDYPDEDCYNIYNNVQCWNNGTYGLQISRMHSVTISNSYFSGNGLVGLFLYDDEDFNIHNCSMTLNADGIIVSLSENININNCSASLNKEDGIYFDTVNDINIDNCSASLNGKNGIYFDTVNDINIDNCSASLNGKNGIYFDTVNDINITNVIAKNNDTYSGIVVNGYNDVKLTSCQSYDDESLQEYGLALSGINTGISLLNCKLTSNVIAEIYNPAGAVVTVVTDKMLAKF